VGTISQINKENVARYCYVGSSEARVKATERFSRGHTELARAQGTSRRI